MTGKVYFISASYEDSGKTIVENYDNREGWFKAKSFCEDSIKLFSEETDDELSCEQRCFCGLYRLSLIHI